MLYAGFMAGEIRSFKRGKAVTVTAPQELTEKVADNVAAVVAQVFGSRSGAHGRARRADPADRLSTDRIVEVAIDQMRQHGYDAVTMRSIARELGTGPASLYAHVANRAELDQLVVGRVCSQWQVPDPDPDRWDDQLRESLVDLLQLYRDNPGVARCTMGMVPLDPGALMVSERWIALLKAGGVSDQHVAWFIDMCSLYVAAVAMEEDMWRMPGPSADSAVPSEEAMVANIRSVFEQLPEDHFPLLRALASTMTTGTADDRFRFGLDLIVGGLKAMSRPGA
jgi:AcrR family transcriptional regulator